jgi:UDP-N-acetylglucosamine 2-epimerase (non-hydrolysing)
VLIEYSSTKYAIEKHSPSSLTNIFRVNTLAYHEYLGLLRNAKFIISDSSGIRDEATYLGIPCITIRESTHRNDTTGSHNNLLVGADTMSIMNATLQVIATPTQHPIYPPEWSLDAGNEIGSVIVKKG